jgi:hypothetical protein
MAETLIDFSKFSALTVSLGCNYTHCQRTGSFNKVGVHACPQVTNEFLVRTCTLHSPKVVKVVINPDYAGTPGCDDCPGAIELAKLEQA